jgi:hypothetical protein
MEESRRYLPVLAVTTAASRGALSSVLEAFAVFFKTAALHAITALVIRPCSKIRNGSILMVFAAMTGALFSATLTRSVALAVLGLAIGFQASAAYLSLGGGLLE